MHCNVGGIERPIRMILGIVLLGMGMFAELSPIAMGSAFVVGTIALITGAIGFCPLWSLVGVNTCPTQQPRKQH